MKIPIQTLKVGSLGTHNLLGLAKAKKAVILLFNQRSLWRSINSSTDESYFGNVNPIGPEVYDEAKDFEAITMACHNFIN